MAQVASEAKVGAGEAEVLADGAGEVIGRSPTQLFWRRFRRDRYAIAGLTFIIILAALALGAPVFAKLTSHGANEHFIYTGTAPDGLPLGPSTKFWFGHDQLGQDLFIRVLYGARTSMAVAIFATIPGCRNPAQATKVPSRTRSVCTARPAREVNGSNDPMRRSLPPYRPRSRKK